MKRNGIKAAISSLLLAVLCLAMTTAQAAGHPFTDVPAGAYYESAVVWALDHGVTTGTTASTFSPSGACTRGQVVTFLWRAQGNPEPKATENPFTDVPQTAYYYKAVLWAVEQGITNGTDATTFSPQSTCLRSHVITFIWRAQGKPAAAGQSALANSYGDSAYYKQAVAWADTNGMLTGVGAGAFNAGELCPRSDIVTYLYRFAEGKAAGGADAQSSNANTDANAATQTGGELRGGVLLDNPDYVLNVNTLKFHRPGCRSVPEIKIENRLDFKGDRADVLAMGFQPCGYCHP